MIITDGHENSSKRFSYREIKRMIEAKKELGWEFLFLGANIDAAAKAERIGIARDRSVTYENDSEGVRLNFDAVGEAVLHACKASSFNADEALCLSDDWAERIEEYRESKQRKDKIKGNHRGGKG